MYICICPLPMQLILGLSLALRSHDQLKGGGGGRVKKNAFFFFEKKSSFAGSAGGKSKKYHCYYPHGLKDSLSPACSNFKILNRKILGISFNIGFRYKIHFSFVTKYLEPNHLFLLIMGTSYKYKINIRYLTIFFLHILLKSISIFNIFFTYIIEKYQI